MLQKISSIDMGLMAVGAALYAVGAWSSDDWIHFLASRECADSLLGNHVRSLGGRYRDGYRRIGG